MSYLDFDFDLFFYPTRSFELIFNPLGTERNENHQLIHIATAGGYIPRPVYDNGFNHRIRYELKNNGADTNSPVWINPNLESILGSSLDKNTDKISALDIYTRDFSEYAKRNCYSFDRTHISYPRRNLYHLVAAPLDDKLENKIPNQNLSYRFCFRMRHNLIFLILNKKNIYPFKHNDFPSLIDYKIIGFAPLEFY